MKWWLILTATPLDNPILRGEVWMAIDAGGPLYMARTVLTQYGTTLSQSEVSADPFEAKRWVGIHLGDEAVQFTRVDGRLG